MLIAQISDCHIKARGKWAYRVVDTASCLKEAVATLARLDPAPDIVVATGDLTDFGRPEEYELLRELLAPLVNLLPWASVLPKEPRGALRRSSPISFSIFL
jgi:3',5'-cyclic-AMP phosphodiesterase